MGKKLNKGKDNVKNESLNDIQQVVDNSAEFCNACGLPKAKDDLNKNAWECRCGRPAGSKTRTSRMMKVLDKIYMEQMLPHMNKVINAQLDLAVGVVVETESKFTNRRIYKKHKPDAKMLMYITDRMAGKPVERLSVDATVEDRRKLSPQKAALLDNAFAMMDPSKVKAPLSNKNKVVKKKVNVNKKPKTRSNNAGKTN